MAFVYFDRVKETSTTTGTGSITLGGAVSGFISFSSVYSAGDTMYYCITDQNGANWEVGLGTYNSGALARTTVKASSNAGAAVNFTSGSLYVFTTIAAAQFGGTTGSTTGSGAVVLATNPVLAGASSTAPVSATSFVPTSSTPATDGLYLPSSHVVGISANNNLVATFSNNGAGGDYITHSNAAVSGQSSISAPTACTSALAGGGAGNLSAGGYSYKTTYLSPTGETSLGAASNTTTVVTPSANGKIALSAIPLSANGTVTARNLYRTKAGGSSYYFVAKINDNTTTIYTDNIADTSLAYSGATGQAQVPTYVQVGATSASDTSVGVQYRALGTTTSGFQFNGNNTQGGLLSTAKHQFYCNNVLQLEVTDTLFNPNQDYQGAVTSYWQIGGGALAAGPDNIAMLCAKSDIYPSSTAVIGAHGTTGGIHFLNNGLLGHVSIAAPGNTSGTDVYATPNILWLSGSQAGSGADALIYTNYGNSDSTIGITFYNEGSGGYTFYSDNTASACFKMFRAANGINGVYSKAAATGGTPLIGGGFGGASFSADANCPMGITSSGTGSVKIYDQAGSNLIAQFTDTGSIVNALSMTGGATGQGPIITAGGPSVETNVPIFYKALGTGAHTFYNAGAATLTVSGGASTVNRIAVSSANTGLNPSISAQGGDATAGLLIYTSGTGNITFQTANTANTILTLANTGNVTANTGNLVMGTAAKGLVLKQGSNGKCGTFVLNGATPVTVSNTSIAITDTIVCSLNTVGGTVGTSGPNVRTITAATGFTIAGVALDTSTYNYVIISNAP